MFTTDKCNDFSSLAESLKLNQSFVPASPLITNHIAKVQQLLEDFVRKEPLISEKDRVALSSLREESFLRLLVSPYICELLMILKGPQSLSSEASKQIRIHLIQALVAEIKRLKPDFYHVLNPPWTINGDFVFD